jgi:heme/copper-type cytochrome/quinol oxidase subunit 3
MVEIAALIRRFVDILWIVIFTAIDRIADR